MAGRAEKMLSKTRWSYGAKDMALSYHFYSLACRAVGATKWRHRFRKLFNYVSTADAIVVYIEWD